MPDDELLAADGWRLDGDIGFHLGRHRAGDTMRLTLNRRGRVLELDVPLFATRSHRYRIEADPEAGTREAALYRAWLHLPE
jgi:predicted metalloprotease with PDZ domain